jgi:uridylate kinase
VARQVKRVTDLGARVAIVPGAGNLVRGAAFSRREETRAAADQMGMLGTIVNAIAIATALEDLGLETRLLSALPIDRIGEPCSPQLARRYLDAGLVVLFAGGTGNPFFSTDTAAVLRAKEAGCDVVLKATKVDGVYDSDPKKNPNARRHSRIGFARLVREQLGVMDLAAAAFCLQNPIPVIVFDFFCEGNLERAVKGEEIGTVIGGDDD